MAALLEKVRNFHEHPVMSEEERAAEYGTYTPTKRRASLPAAQRRAANQLKNGTPADIQDYEGSPTHTRTTDDLENEPHTSKHPIPMRGRGNNGNNNDGQGSYRPGHSFGRVLINWLCGIAGIATLLYTIVFFIVAGYILLANIFSYGPTHTAYTQATLNGKPYTIQTSNVQGTILITLINNQDGTIKTYSYTDLNPNAWNNDLSGIVATADVEMNQGTPTVTVHLIGNVNYFHLFFTRPQMKLFLLPDKQAGYKVVTAS